MDDPDCTMDLSLRLQSLLQNIHWDKEHVKQLFEALVKRFKRQQQALDFHTWVAKILHKLEFLKIDPNLSLWNSRNVIDLVNDPAINNNQLLEMLREDKEIDLKEILEDLSQQGVDRRLIEKVKRTVTSVVRALSNGNSKSLEEEIEEKLYEMCKVIYDQTSKKSPNQTQERSPTTQSNKKSQNNQTTGMESPTAWRPRTTQMVSWCLLAFSSSSYLLQVRTGEGKSCIVAMFAAYRAVKDKKVVDIISSSPVLAERDAKDWKSFYEAFGLKVGCNTNISNEEDLKKCYNCHIVYGTTDSFAGDWLRHHFLRKGVRDRREFQCVIVDEVDSLMLDKGLEVVYLSSKIPAMQSMNAVLLWIWSLVCQHKKMDRGETAGPIQSFVQILKETTDITSDTDVLHILKLSEDKNIFPKGFTKDMKQLDLENLLPKLECVDKTQIVEFFRLVETQFPNYCFRLFSVGEDLNRAEYGIVGGRKMIPLLHFKGGLCRRLFPDKEAVFDSVEQMMRKTLQFTGPEKTPEDAHIIGFQHLVYSKLRVWVENAFRATEMVLGDEYVAKGETVVPVDYQCTGVVQNNMRWSDGLQQFLEMKHEAKVSNMTVITNFMSSVQLFKMYGDQVFGVTGTLGNKDEIEMLQNLYKNINTCTIPPFKRRKLYEEEGKCLTEEKEWLEAIQSTVKAKVCSTPYREERAVLVICETINRAKVIQKAIKDEVKAVQVITYTDNNLDSEIAKVLEPRDVIIATNLAGRGTDLQVSKNVNEAGGLFVLQTFLPLNIRVEEQAFGRTGRKGNPGSAQLIICANHFFPEISEITLDLQRIKHFNELCILKRETAQNELLEALMPVLRDDSDTQSWQNLATTLDHLLTQLATDKNPIEEAKHFRDYLTKHRMSLYLTRDIPRSTKKEALFSLYLDLIEEIHKKHENSKMLDTIVESMHECWGLWLMTRFDENESEEKLKCMFKEAMGNAQKLLEKEISPSSAVYFYIRRGNELRHQKCLEKSFEMYSKALEDDDQHFIALYNHALSVMQMKRENYVTEAWRDLEKAGESMGHIMRNTEDALQYVANTGPGPLTVFRNQLNVRLHVYINEALNKLKVAHNNGGGVTVTENHIFTLVDFQYLVRHPIDVVEELANLQLVGLTEIISLNTTFSLAGFLSKVIRNVEKNMKL